MGHLADPLVGGVFRLSKKRADPELVPFDWLFKQMTDRALKPDVVARLMGGAGSDVVATRARELEALFDATGPTERQRHWRFVVTNYERFRTGAIAWRAAFGAWPLLPMLDRAVLTAVAEIPPASIAHRSAQDELLRTRFPELARLPLVVRNAAIEAPLRATRLERLRYGAMGRLARMGPAALFRRGRERRYNYRLYDFNGPGWRAVRRAAEPHRERLGALLNADELNRLLPGPEATIPMADAVHGAHGLKQLVGLMLWAGTHLP
jgi:asparagine synthase (glutamine-hydrolysing)